MKKLCGLCLLAKKLSFAICDSEGKELYRICERCHEVYMTNKVRDWEYHKSTFIYQETVSAISHIQNIEETISSPIERIAFLYMLQFIKSQYGAMFISPQHQIGPYFVDFMIEYRPTGKKLIIECDGHDFHEKTKEQVSKDKARERYLVKEGYTVLRYSGSDIVKNPSKLVEDIIEIFDPMVYVAVWNKLSGIPYKSRGDTDGEESFCL